MAAADVEFRCFVGGLAWATDERGLRDAFQPYGEVVDSKVINDRETGRSRGFGFVTFADEKSMQDAIDSMNGKELDGRNITVNQAQNRSGGGGGGYGGGGGGGGSRSGSGYGGSGGYGGGRSSSRYEERSSGYGGSGSSRYDDRSGGARSGGDYGRERSYGGGGGGGSRSSSGYGGGSWRE